MVDYRAIAVVEMVRAAGLGTPWKSPAGNRLHNFTIGTGYPFCIPRGVHGSPSRLGRFSSLSL